MAFAARRDLLDQLLRDGQVRRAPALLERGARVLSTGVLALDAALGGGLVRGQLHEFVGPPGAGGTALLRAALGAATRAGELCALVDPGDSFDPSQPGIDLQRLLWVRPQGTVLALRAAEIALEARFALVALDLGDVCVLPNRCRQFSRGDERAVMRDGSIRRFQRPLAPPDARRSSGARDVSEVRVVRFEKRASPGASPWARLVRRAERHGGALLLLARAPQAGTFAAAVVELERDRTLWEGRPGAPGRFLRGAFSNCAVGRHKRMPPSGALGISLPLEGE